jgi:broad specificity phosphatase PhoE
MGQVLLVRHGQASFGAADYDVLSDLGWTQGRVLGARLAAEGLAPTALVTGGMRRHDETATAITDGAGWAAVPVEVDPGWAEFDHLGVVAALPDAGPVDSQDRRGFQRLFERATARWASGEHDDDYAEAYGDFVARASDALARACDREGSVVVVSSGGPIAAACAALVAQGAPAGTDAVLPTLWRHFNTVQVNANVTRVLVGPSGRRLLTFNEHAHLAPETLSYR